METSIIVTGLFLTNITWTNDWCNIDNFNITTNWLTKRHTTSGSTGLLCRQRNMYPSKNLFWNYYSIFPAPLPMTDRYISIVNHHLLIMIIFIPATLKYFSSIILVLIKHYSCIQHYPILLTILPNCVGPILPPATFQQCRRLNFCKENDS